MATKQGKPLSAIYQASEWGAKFHSRRETEVFGAGAAGPGKAIALTTLIPTPKGMRYFKDIHVGDIVFNRDGSQVKVLAETEVWNDRDCYQLAIASEKIIASAEHQWCIEGGFIKTTEQIHNSQAFRTYVPTAKAVEYNPRNFILDPYVLGVCLLRGQPRDRSVFTTWDPELYSSLRDIGYHLDDCGYKVCQIRERKDKINELVSSTNRRIPDEYLYGSFNDRMALVEGIMDGGYGRGPECKREDLPFLTDFYTLCASLGLVPRIHKFRAVDKWYLKISSKQYRCSRFTGTHLGAENKLALRHGIKTIKRVPSVPVKCIQVSGGGTFLITKSFIVTHNSMVLLADPLEQVQIEHLRCQQSEIPNSFPPELKTLIEENPLKWGHSEGWALHLRRTMPRLSTTIERAHRMFKQLDPDADWNEKKSIWTFSSGYKYQFGGCKDRTDQNNYLGQEYSWIGFDELVEFNKDQYQFISTRCRSGDRVMRALKKIRSASNPRLSGNKGEDILLDDPGWVKKYFVDPCPEGNKVIRKKVVRRDGTVEEVTRLFMPATLYDNPDKEFVKDYELKLMSMPKHIRDIYLYGRWDTVVGSFLEDTWNTSVHVCKPFKIPISWPVFRSMDWGYRSNGIVGWFAMSPEGTLYLFYEVAFKEKTATWVAKNIIKPFEEKNKLWNGEKGSKITGPADTQIQEQRGESARTKYMEFCDEGVMWLNADKKSRQVNAEVMVARLRDHDNYTKTPGLVIFENCKTSIQTIPAMQTDPNNVEEPKKGGWDHSWDMVTYACQWAKQSNLDAPQYKPDFKESLDDADEMIENGLSNNGWGYY